MMDPPDTCWGVCNTSTPMLYKYLINTYLLNHIPGKYWIIRVRADCIRPTNANVDEQMIDPYGMFLSICNTPLSIPDKSLINAYLLNHIPDKN